MIITPLSTDLISPVRDLMATGEPYIRVRGDSDYWLYAHLFASTCPIAIDGEAVTGAVIAFRSQTQPTDIYIQDVITHPDYRRQGITTQLLATLTQQATTWNCQRMYLTSEPDNTTAHHTWTTLGFTNLPGDWQEHSIHVTADYKGPGKHRAIYERTIPAVRE